jgi:hypothetical protein
MGGGNGFRFGALGGGSRREGIREEMRFCLNNGQSRVVKGRRVLGGEIAGLPKSLWEKQVSSRGTIEEQ